MVAEATTPEASFEMNRLASLFLAFLILPGVSACAENAATQPTTRQTPEGISYTHVVRKDPPMHLHVVTVDLTNPAIHLVVAPGTKEPVADDPWETTLQRVSEVARREGLAVAVNGDFFMSKNIQWIAGRKVPYFIGNEARVCGFAMSDGTLWSARDAEPSLVVHKDGTVTIGSFRTPPRDAWQIVSGSTQIVTFGRNTGGHDPVAPRTAVGIDADGKKMVLLVVDGRRPEYSAGMSTADEADEMIRLGCHQALNLDGGGSSTMVLRDPAGASWNVINRPSDGHDLFLPLSIERAVANTFGVRVDPPNQGK